MRRRSERKKSADVSPVATSRRSSRRTRRTPDTDRNEDSEQQLDETPTKADSSSNRGSSEERVESTRRGRTTRSVRAPAKRRLRSISTTETKKIEAIAEEENGLTASCEEKEAEKLQANKIAEEEEFAEQEAKEDTAEVVAETEAEVVVSAAVEPEKPAAVEEDTETAVASACEPKSNSNEQQKISEVLMAGTVQAEEDATTAVAVAADAHVAADEQVQEGKTPESAPTSEESNTESEKVAEKDAEEEAAATHTPKQAEPEEKIVAIEIAQAEESNADKSTASGNAEHIEQTAEIAVSDANVAQITEKTTQVEEQPAPTQVTNNNNGVSAEQTRTRKRKWLSKKGAESKEPILAISTDSLKNLIADVHPVPLSDVQLESSSEVEELPSPRGEVIDEGSTSPSDNERRRNSLDTTGKEKTAPTVTVTPGAAAVSVPKTLPVHGSPSPPRNQTSSVLYITNLVRPFTVLQLKGLLARTGKIVENGFWIDRIKSKCYVQYETEE